MTKAEEVAALALGLGCLGKSQDDEPVFILVARDKYAASTVRDWANRIIAIHGSTTKACEALEQADRMDAWRDAHGGGKVPD